MVTSALTVISPKQGELQLTKTGIHRLLNTRLLAPLPQSDSRISLMMEPHYMEFIDYLLSAFIAEPKLLHCRATYAAKLCWAHAQVCTGWPP